MVEATATKQRWQIIAGSHSDDYVEPIDPKDPNRLRTPKIYRAGDVFDSVCDLSKQNSPGCIKFRKVDPSTPLSNPYDTPAKVKGSSEAPINPNLSVDDRRQTYETMTVDALRRHAAEEEIDLGDATKKSDIIDRLLAV